METESLIEEMDRVEPGRALSALARDALQLWEFDGASVELLKHGENATFKVGFQGLDYVLRLARVESHDRVEHLSELVWLKELRRSSSIHAPLPVPFIGDCYIKSVVSEGRIIRRAMMFHWVDGEHRMDPGDEETRKTAELMAALHAHSRSWRKPSFFSRPHLDSTALLSPCAGLFPSWKSIPTLSPSQRDLFSRASTALRFGLRRWESETSPILIHGDLQPHNILFHEGRACPIDFDDCGWAHPALDVAIALPGAWSPDFDRTWELFVDAYAVVCGQVPFTKKQVHAYRLAWELMVLGWLGAREEDVPRFKGWATAHANKLEPWVNRWLAEGG